MSYLQEAMKEAGATPEENTTTTTTTTTDSTDPTGAQAGTVPDSPTDDEGKADSSSAASPEGPQDSTGSPEENPGENQEPPADEQKPKPKPDLSKLTKEEKAEHAFKRQLARQREKYETQINRMMDEFGTIRKEVEEIKKSASPEARKTRADFETDDQYIDWLTEQKVNGILDRKNEESEKERREREEAERRNAEMTAGFRTNCEATFPGEQYGEFATRVNKALENGLGEILDKAPVIRDFVFTHPDGPRVLNAMLTDRNTFMEVMNNAYDPNYARLALINTAASLRNPKPAPVQEPAPAPAEQPKPKGMPAIGKPGSRQGAGTAPLATDMDAIKFIRTHR